MWRSEQDRSRTGPADVVFFTEDCDADYVRRALIDHDGYPSSTVVERTT